jgi:hypothetical protein
MIWTFQELGLFRTIDLRLEPWNDGILEWWVSGRRKLGLFCTFAGCVPRSGPPVDLAVHSGIGFVSSGAWSAYFSPNPCPEHQLSLFSASRKLGLFGTIHSPAELLARAADFCPSIPSLPSSALFRTIAPAGGSTLTGGSGKRQFADGLPCPSGGNWVCLYNTSGPRSPGLVPPNEHRNLVISDLEPGCNRTTVFGCPASLRLRAQ